MLRLCVTVLFCSQILESLKGTLVDFPPTHHLSQSMLSIIYLNFGNKGLISSTILSSKIIYISKNYLHIYVLGFSGKVPFSICTFSKTHLKILRE